MSYEEIIKIYTYFSDDPCLHIALDFLLAPVVYNNIIIKRLKSSANIPSFEHFLVLF